MNEISSDENLTLGSVTVPEAPQPVFESIIDMYCALGFPPVADADTPYDADSPDRGSSTPEDDLLPATDGSSEPTSASASDETSETAVPSRSTGGIGYYSDDSLWFTPSSSHSSIAQSPEGLLARFPPSGQVHSPQREAWLQGMINRLQEMQRQGDHHGRVYDGYPELEASLPATPDMGDSTTSAEHTTLSSPSEQGTRLITSAPASFESGLDSMAEHTPRESLAVGGLSTTVSQDMLYDRLASLVDYESELGDDDAEDKEGRVGMEAGDGSNVSPADDPSNTPLPSNPRESLAVGGLSTAASQDMLYDEIGSLVDYSSEAGDDDEDSEEAQVEMEAGDNSNSLANDPSNIPLPPSPYVESPSTIVGGIVSEIDELLSMKGGKGGEIGGGVVGWSGVVGTRDWGWDGDDEKLGGDRVPGALEGVFGTASATTSSPPSRLPEYPHSGPLRADGPGTPMPDDSLEYPLYAISNIRKGCPCPCPHFRVYWFVEKSGGGERVSYEGKLLVVHVSW
ncbi:hypothetical protein RSOLAG22IIIB_13827 [Rhizoctonia solani]|uniref:Uncharacterized protein n=1 Tax=Rhizoctonia solani TaxID=456999 RepID=A0A0K6FR81_9AGAM|nr:hypothetical protein RSOLAG22IIIB_13827 [Rhizoctonia solani]